MHGVLSRANLWVNGRKVADASQLQGAYSRYEYDVTSLVRDGANAIALDVYPNDSGDHGFLTLSMVDWNPPVARRLDRPAVRPRPGPGRAALAAGHPRRPARRSRPGAGRPHRAGAASQQHRPGAGRDPERRPRPGRTRRSASAAMPACRRTRPARSRSVRPPSPQLTATPPGRLVAVPDGRAAAVPPAARGGRPRSAQRHREHDDRHSHRQPRGRPLSCPAAPTGAPGTASS